MSMGFILPIHKSILVIQKILSFLLFLQENTLKPLYNKVRYNTVLDITRFKDGFQKCIDYNEMVIFLYNLYILFGYNTVV